MNYFKLNIILLLLLISTFTYSDNWSETYSCNYNDVNKFLDDKQLVSMSIEVQKHRKWVKNYFNLINSTTYIDDRVQINRFIDDKYKKKFKADILIFFDNGLECQFPAKIRINGDKKDHVDAAPGVASLDVRLLSGNINSIIKFKLLLPHTRGGDNEIFTANLLRETGFLSPRTQYVNTTLNGNLVKYIFQEKITKEFVESNKLREAPILEGDERFLFGNDMDWFDRFGLSRIVNYKWTSKGLDSLEISKDALAVLNKAYLEYLIHKHYYKNYNDERFLNARILGGGSEYLIKKNREFMSILLVLGATHGLRPHNRNFYYDPMYEGMLPIYYDGEPSVMDGSYNNSSLEKIREFGNRYSRDEVIESQSVINLINNLNKNKFRYKLKLAGLDIKQELLDEKINTIIKLLKHLSLSEYFLNDNISYKTYFSIYDDKKKRLIFDGSKKLQVFNCDLHAKNCINEEFTLREYSKILGGKYIDVNNVEYIYIGNKLAYENLLSKKSNNNSNIRLYQIENKSQLTTYGEMDALIDRDSRNIHLYQNNINDKAVINGGFLKNWTINYHGSNKGILHNKQRFNVNLYTGCLTLLDIKVFDINVNVNDAMCEDGVNFIRVSGSVNDINIRNVKSDALDVDFSDLVFDKIKVKGAGNDCIDLSSGKYKIFNSILSECQDKAISVGEGSEVYLSKINVFNANTGIAVKDSSIANIQNSTFKDVDVCFSSYNKKQEFWGGRLQVDNHNCKNDKIYQQNNSVVEAH